MFQFGDNEYFWKCSVHLLQFNILCDFGLLNSKNFKRISFQSFQVPHNLFYPHFSNYFDCHPNRIVRTSPQWSMWIQDSKQGIFLEIYYWNYGMRDLHLFDVLFQDQNAKKLILCKSDFVRLLFYLHGSFRTDSAYQYHFIFGQRHYVQTKRW
jgi:hypothetical protein